ncbi:MAG: hypothetical protein HZB13_09655, partial [Acidobacteria bacterium]|nr:hypothetical protein [Acidobacteriota bacterium]
WTVEQQGIAVFAPGVERPLRLSYPEAAVWELLTRGQSSDVTAGKLRAIAHLDESGAEGLVRRQLKAWLAAGLIQRGGADV